MLGEEFRICLTAICKTLCEHTPRTMPFTYRDNLKVELDFLETQNIIAPITEATTWCAPIVHHHTKEELTKHPHVCQPLSSQSLCYLREISVPHPSQAVADIAASDSK